MVINELYYPVGPVDRLKKPHSHPIWASQSVGRSHGTSAKRMMRLLVIAVGAAGRKLRHGYQVPGVRMVNWKLKATARSWRTGWWRGCTFTD